MALQGPDLEDRNKLHSEVNQYINLRFATAIAAVSLFGVVTGAMINSLETELEKGIVTFSTFLISSAGIIVYVLLHYVTMLLLSDIHFLTAYLQVTGGSRWERDLLELQKDEKNGRRRLGRFFGMNRIILRTFAGIVVITAVLPFVIAFTHGYDNSALVESAIFSAAVALAALCYLFKARGGKLPGCRTEDEWHKVWLDFHKSHHGNSQPHPESASEEDSESREG